MDDDDQIGLELNSSGPSSRNSSYNDLTGAAVAAIAANASSIVQLPALQEEYLLGNTLVVPISPNKKLARPTSYSDSFLVLGLASGSGFLPAPGISPVPTTGKLNSAASEPLLCQPLALSSSAATPVATTGGLNSLAPAQTTHQPAPKLNKFLSILTHITLIGIFETVFYFQFISKSEDNGIQNTINQFLQGALTQCKQWPQNTTQLLAAFLQIVVNETQVAQAAATATAARAATNGTLQTQSWMYVVSLAASLAAIATAAHCKKYEIKWRSILVENVVLVCMLGAYEAFFFETIIYMYQSLTLPELEQSILQQLQTFCNI